MPPEPAVRWLVWPQDGTWSGSETGIISINVSAKDPEYPNRTAALANESLKLIGNRESRWMRAGYPCTDLNYYLPGYEIPNEAASGAIKLLAVKGGLLTDPVYTGKAFAGMLDYIRTKKVPAGSNVVLFYGRAGPQRYFAEKEILGDLSK